MAMNTNEWAVRWILKDASFYVKHPNKYTFYNDDDEFVGVAFYEPNGEMSRATYIKKDYGDRWFLRYNSGRDGESNPIEHWIKNKLQTDAKNTNAPPAIRRKRDGDSSRDMIFGSSDITPPRPAPGVPIGEDEKTKRELMELMHTWKSVTRKSKKKKVTSKRFKSIGVKPAQRKMKSNLLQRIAKMTGVHLNRK